MTDNKKTRIIGYARVSTEDQNLDGQVKALRDYGCDHVFTEKASGARMQRKVLSRALSGLKEGDTFVIWKLDRLGRTLKGLMEVVEHLTEWKVDFVSMSDGIETKTIGGRLVFQIMGAIAEFERAQISERTKLGIAARKAAGVRFGPKHSIADNVKRLKVMQKLQDSGQLEAIDAKQAIELLNKADPSAKPIAAPQTFYNWRYGGYKGLIRIEDEPLDLDDT